MTTPSREQVMSLLRQSLEEAGIVPRTHPKECGWEIHVNFRKMKNEICGVEVDLGYTRAEFYFDLVGLATTCEKTGDPDAWLREHVRHEVVHVLLAPLANFAEYLCEDDQAMKKLFTDAMEAATKNVTILWCRLAEREKS
ncbi:MAG: hypothetical protein KatS3mg109_1347 [Pirellulaceae bacterium]|nr:MAG: hypothetical protein KatS3mg109_0382 [Pirellulaceae bacterium]GIW90777.1 MAG: hypothetical protein KatS3mg109_1209 [Pirellulaceae bacterium]GIW90915.1 MAG: hypothetical protein KatS3mg109_1347 [Pirellulaceae bacterium]